VSGEPGKAEGRGSSRFLAGCVVGFLLGVLLAGGAAWWGIGRGLAILRSFDTPWKGYPGEEVFVVIPPGRARLGGRAAPEAGVIPTHAALSGSCSSRGSGKLQAGEYRFAKPETRGGWRP